MLEIENKKLKTKKKITIGMKIFSVFLSFVIIIGSTVGIAYWRYVYPTGKIMPGIYTIRIHNNGMPMGNFFLLQADDGYIAIDAGGDNAETEEGLKKLGISADDVIAVFVTHAHWDHVGSINVFSEAIIYTGNSEGSEFPDIPHEIMSDGEIKEISGLSIQCLYTPGHTTDHVCYLVDGRYLFVGDLLVTTNDPPPPNPPRYDKELQLEHRAAMLNLDGVDYVFTGHFGLFKAAWFYRWWF